jgi:hypothetical protein
MTSPPKSPAEFGNALAADRTLRLEGGGNLFAAAEKLRVERYIQLSSGFYLAALADEAAPLRVDASGSIGASATMYAELEKRVRGFLRPAETAQNC